MTPNLDAAATKAIETLIRYRINATPIATLPILKTLPNVLVVSFAEMAFQLCDDRENIITTLGQAQDCVTCTKMIDGQFRYIVAYNQRLPFYMLQRAAARELGHIILGHNGSRPKEVREAEASCFALHLLCPRPVIKGIQDSGLEITVEKLGCITGCYERCLSKLRKLPACHVPAELNKQVKAQFGDYIKSFSGFISLLPNDDDSAIADFGSFMEGYEE